MACITLSLRQRCPSLRDLEFSMHRCNGSHTNQAGLQRTANLKSDGARNEVYLVALTWVVHVQGLLPSHPGYPRPEGL